MTSFASIRLITADVSAMVAFYQRVTGVQAAWSTEQFAEIRTDAAILAIAGTPTLALFGAGEIARPGMNHSLILEFRVADVDAEYARLAGELEDVVQVPTSMPWGNRSLLFRDPEGHLVNLFTPISEAARARFGVLRSRGQ